MLDPPDGAEAVETDGPELSDDDPPEEPAESDEPEEDSALPDFTVLLVEALRESVR